MQFEKNKTFWQIDKTEHWVNKCYEILKLYFQKFEIFFVM